MKQIVNPVFRKPANEGIVPYWSNQSKYLMLGSITAIDGMRKGFYYASDRNQLWALMDYCLGGNNFGNLKNELKQNYLLFASEKQTKEQFEQHKIEIQNRFKQALDEYHFAICDVFKECWFNNNSSLDQDIIMRNDNYPYITSKAELQEIIDAGNVKTIFCNSKFVENEFRKLNIKGDYEIVSLMSPSQRRGVIEKKMADWKPKFDAVIIKNNNNQK